MPERVTLITSDNITLAGDYYPADSSKGAVLLHMMPAERTSYAEFGRKLQQAGFQALAIDFRGHGESEGGPDGYRRFSDVEHQQSLRDVEAAVKFMTEKGVSDFHLVGASIGANLALEYGVSHPDVKSLVLLSPGLNYKGIETEPLIAKLTDGPAVLLAAAEDDSESYEAVRSLVGRVEQSEKRKVKIFEKAGHGTAIFESVPQFMDEVVSWMGTL